MHYQGDVKILSKYQDWNIVGLTEKIIIEGPDGEKKEVIARIDTGATSSSIDAKLAEELKLGPVLKSKIVKSASGTTTRPIVEASITIAEKKIKANFTLADRAQMKYRALIGQNILAGNNFLIDPNKT